MRTVPDLTVIVTPRERLSSLGMCLRSLAAATDDATEFIVVNQGYSAGDLRRAAEIVAPRELRVVNDGSFLTEGEGKNLGLAHARAPVWALLVDGEMTVARDAVVHLRRAAEETGADIVGPVTLEGTGLVHAVGGFLAFPDSPGGSVEVRGLNQYEVLPKDHHYVRGEVEVVEQHVVLVNRRTIGDDPFDPRLARLFFHDFALTAHTRGWRTVFEPQAVALFHRPPPIPWRDLKFFRQQWNRRRFETEGEHFRAKWGYSPPSEWGREWEEWALACTSIFPPPLRNPLTQTISNLYWRIRKRVGVARRQWRFGKRGLVTP